MSVKLERVRLVAPASPPSRVRPPSVRFWNCDRGSVLDRSTVTSTLVNVVRAEESSIVEPPVALIVLPLS